GAHVLTEKPIATTLADARIMIESCRAHGVRLMVAYPVRFSAAAKTLKGSLDTNLVGFVAGCVGANNSKAPMGQRSWFNDASLAGGGALMDHTVHLADLLLHVRDARVRSVYAQANRIIHEGQVQVETGGFVIANTDDGASYTIDFSWDLPQNVPTWGGLR